MRPDADLVLVGGGLANALIAWRLRQARPDLRLLVLEAGPALGGNHTWSFHAADLSAAQHAWIAPLVAHRWEGYSVRFPAFTRRLPGGYASITSARLHEVVATQLADVVRVDTPVAAVAPTQVTLRDGSRIAAGAVLDGRGRPPAQGLRLGWQKFIGREIELAEPHGLPGPILMDATVPQRGGYRFVYTLPLAERRVLVEDTFYADDERLDGTRIRDDIDAYVAGQGWRAGPVVREEQGVLPIVLEGDPSAWWDDGSRIARTGLSAALFHPTTGYSLAEAVRLADRVAAQRDLRAGPLFDAVRAHALDRWRAQGFYRLLNRMFFEAAVPQERWRVMQQFYRRPEALVERFYAGRLTALDQLRIVSGKPPVPLRAALKAAVGRPATSWRFS